jgi:uncharacterized protein YqgC (DUF456 family)
MALQIIVTVVAGLLLIVAAFGTIYPILPGSLLAIAVLIGWGWVIGTTVSWTIAAVGSVMCLAGWSASFVLTGRKLRQHEVPGVSIVVAMVAGIVGMFVIPVVGLFVGFALGLLASEWIRRNDFSAAVRSSMEALKATGIGVLIEFCMVCLAGSVWTIGVILHFALD